MAVLLLGYLLAPLALLLAFLALVACDLAYLLLGRARPGASLRRPATKAVSVVIPNWSGEEILKECFPALVSELDVARGDEIILVDNASSDRSVDVARAHWLDLRVILYPKPFCFAEAVNAGVRAARNDIVVVLNNDMKVAPGFVRALVERFDHENVFAVTGQIFFQDATRRREESGLTVGGFARGWFWVSHKIESVERPWPVFYAGGGSTAFDREKFLALGGFDPLFTPVYAEDTELSYRAWKRGWWVIYEPGAVVYHRHRGTVGRRFSEAEVRVMWQTNFVLFAWKSMHRTAGLVTHFLRLGYELAARALGSVERRAGVRSLYRAFWKLPEALAARWQARELALLSDRDVFQAMQPAYFRDRLRLAARPRVVPERLNILIVSPYSIFPVHHGGAALMYNAIKHLSPRHNLHLLSFVDTEEELRTNRELERYCREVRLLLRRSLPQTDFVGLTPYAVKEFRSPEFLAELHRMIYCHDIDVVEIEYTQMAQYFLDLRTTAFFLDEHNVYFLSVLRTLLGSRSLLVQLQSLREWLRAFRYELRMCEKFDCILAMTPKEQAYLRSFLRNERVSRHSPAGIDVSEFPPRVQSRREPSLLFVGYLRHEPNVTGICTFCEKVFPRIRARVPEVQLYIAGAEAPPEILELNRQPGVHVLGFVPDLGPFYERCGVFVAPILSGAGVRIKILEAFAAGIPVVSTPIGAEGLEVADGRHLLIAEGQADFAAKIELLLQDQGKGCQLAAAARQLMETRYSWAAIAERLEETYRQVLAEKWARIP